jgi:hypothetical protein
MERFSFYADLVDLAYYDPLKHCFDPFSDEGRKYLKILRFNSSLSQYFRETWPPPPPPPGLYSVYSQLFAPERSWLAPVRQPFLRPQKQQSCHVFPFYHHHGLHRAIALVLREQKLQNPPPPPQKEITKADKTSKPLWKKIEPVLKWAKKLRRKLRQRKQRK